VSYRESDRFIAYNNTVYRHRVSVSYLVYNCVYDNCFFGRVSKMLDDSIACDVPHAVAKHH
ncbi:MAG: hypothetical protein K2M02_07325, partial [Duncaniella sp.]|nr:hypothetical protein [Duncaniella sp.]